MKVVLSDSRYVRILNPVLAILWTALCMSEKLGPIVFITGLVIFFVLVNVRLDLSNPQIDKAK